MSLPHDMGLDYSIELYGFAIAWDVFWHRLSAFGAERYRLTEAQYYGVMAMFKNGDRRGYLTRLIDARVMTEKQAHEFIGRKWVGRDVPAKPKDEVKQVAITKWVPGDHYYAIDRKFDTFSEAEAYLKRRGYRSLGLRERYAYRDA